MSTLQIVFVALASGLILIAMGVVVIVIAFQGNAMPSSGWQVSLSAHVQHYAHLIKVWAGTLPGWITAIAIFAVLVALGWKALGQIGATGSSETEDEAGPTTQPGAAPRTQPTMQTEELTLER